MSIWGEQLEGVSQFPPPQGRCEFTRRRPQKSLRYVPPRKSVKDTDRFQGILLETRASQFGIGIWFSNSVHSVGKMRGLQSIASPKVHIVKPLRPMRRS